MSSPDIQVIRQFLSHDKIIKCKLILWTTENPDDVTTRESAMTFTFDQKVGHWSVELEGEVYTYADDPQDFGRALFYSPKFNDCKKQRRIEVEYHFGAAYGTWRINAEDNNFDVWNSLGTFKLYLDR